MKSLVRARAYQDTALGAYTWLRHAKAHIKYEIKQGFCHSNPHYDIYRCLSICESVAKIDELMLAIAMETNQKTGRDVFWI